MLKELSRYIRNLPSSDLWVTISYTLEDGATFTRDVVLSDTTLSATAVAAGRTTWDERDILAATGSTLPAGS
jgi:hypothetical protein